MPNPDPSKEYRMQLRRSLLMQLGALEDYMIALGELEQRSVVPKAKREYNHSETVTKVPEYA